MEKNYYFRLYVLHICSTSVAEPVEPKLFETWCRRRSRNYLPNKYLLQSVLRMLGWRKTSIKTHSYGTYFCYSTVLSGNIWQKLELEPEPKLWTKVEPKINNFGSATLAQTKAQCAIAQLFHLDPTVLKELSWRINKTKQWEPPEDKLLPLSSRASWLQNSKIIKMQNSRSARFPNGKIQKCVIRAIKHNAVHSFFKFFYCFLLCPF